MQSIVNAFGTTPNLYALSNLYEYYRIRGIKITTRVWPATVDQINSANQTVPPFLFGFNAVTDNQTFPAANVQNFQEQRWAKARLCSNANQGAKPATKYKQQPNQFPNQKNKQHHNQHNIVTGKQIGRASCRERV